MNAAVTAALVVTVMAVAVVGWRSLKDIAAIEDRSGGSGRVAGVVLLPGRPEGSAAPPVGRPRLRLVGGPERGSLHLVDPTPAA